MRTYYVQFTSQESKYFKKLDNARKYALEKMKEHNRKKTGTTVLSTPINTDKNQYVGRVKYDGIWETNYKLFNPNTGKTVLLTKEWEIKPKGMLGKRIK